MILFSGNSNPQLAQEISKGLSTHLGDRVLRTFADGESYCEYFHTPRGKHTLIIQSISNPVNNNLMDACVMIDAAKRGGAKSITLCAPYLGYGRQDKRDKEKRSPISARMVADMLQVVGIHQLITIDIHNPAIEGFYNVPFLNASTSELLTNDIKQRNYDQGNLVVVSPDAGGVERARVIAKKLNNSDVAIIDKRREKANEVEEMRLIGDVSGKTAILLDDIADTCGTLVKGSDLLYEKGAKTVVVYVSHGVFSNDALERIQKAQLQELVVTNSIRNEEADKVGKIRRISVAPLLLDAIRRAVER